MTTPQVPMYIDVQSSLSTRVFTHFFRALLPAEDRQCAAANDENTRGNEAQNHRNIHALTAEERSVADWNTKRSTYSYH